MILNTLWSLCKEFNKTIARAWCFRLPDESFPLSYVRYIFCRGAAQKTRAFGDVLLSTHRPAQSLYYIGLIILRDLCVRRIERRFPLHRIFKNVLFNSYTTNCTTMARRGYRGNKFVFIKNFRNPCRQQGLGKNAFYAHGCMYIIRCIRKMLSKNKTQRKSQTFSQASSLGVFFSFPSVHQGVANYAYTKRRHVVSHIAIREIPLRPLNTI